MLSSVVERSGGDDADGRSRIVAAGGVTGDEAYLADHFPTFPVLPGVLMLEAMVQAGRLLVAGGNGAAAGAGLKLVLGEVKGLRYGRFIRPAERMLVEVTAGEPEGAGAARVWAMKGAVTVDGAVAASGRFSLRPRRSLGGG